MLHMRTPIRCQPHSPAATPTATQRQPKWSSLQCHCTPRLPSTDTASSRAGVVGRVQSIAKASAAQACIDIGHDLRAVHTRMHALPSCDDMIATLELVCNPDARNAGRATSRFCACIRLHYPHQAQTRIQSTHRPSAARSHCRETSNAAKMAFLRHLFALPSRCTVCW